MSLPHVLKRIRLELARSKEFPVGSANHGYEFVAPLDNNGHIDPHLGRSTGSIAGCAGFGTAPTKKSGVSRTSRAARSARDGCSTTIRAQRTTTRPGTASACTPLPPASMFQSVDMSAGPIPSRSCPSSQPRNRAGIYGVSLG
jgi:hypothetical protein